MTTRRSTLKKVAIAGTMSLAGCIGGNQSGGQGSNGSGNQSNSGNQSGGSGEAEIVMASPFNNDHIQTKILKRSGENFAEKSENGYSVSMKAASLGGEEDQMSAAQNGSIDMHATSAGGLVNAYAPEYGFISTPFVAQSWEHLKAIQDEYAYGDDGLNSQLIKSGNQRTVGVALRGVRGVTSNKAIRKPGDIEGIPMRLPEINSWIMPWKAIGVNVTPVKYDELYSAMQSGTVEASEGPIGQFVDSSLYEVQSHFCETQHMTQGYQQVASQSFWTSLSSNEQDMLSKSVSEAAKWGRKQIEPQFDELKKKVQNEHDTVVIPASEIDQQKFKQKADPKIKQLFENKWEASYDEIMSLAK